MWCGRGFAVVSLTCLAVLPGCSQSFGDKLVDDLVTSPRFACALIQASDEVEFGDLPNDAVVAFIELLDDGTARAILLRGKEERLQFFCEGCDGDCSEMESLWGDRFMQYPDVETARWLIPVEHPEVARIVGPSDFAESADGEAEE